MLCLQGIGYNFDFKLSYKYLKKSDAHLRYGNSTFQTWRGQMITGSYCDRILDQCDRKLCRVQSPNFPGAYPRNVTCYYRIEQRTAPKSKRALIVVRQPNAHKIHIKDQVINYDRSQRTLRYVCKSILCMFTKTVLFELKKKYWKMIHCSFDWAFNTSVVQYMTPKHP